MRVAESESRVFGGKLHSDRSSAYARRAPRERLPHPPPKKRKITKTAEDEFRAGLDAGWEHRGAVEDMLRTGKLWQKEGKTEREMGWEKTKDIKMEDVVGVAGSEKWKGRQLEKALNDTGQPLQGGL